MPTSDYACDLCRLDRIWNSTVQHI